MNPFFFSPFVRHKSSELFSVLFGFNHQLDITYKHLESEFKVRNHLDQESGLLCTLQGGRELRQLGRSHGL